MDHQASDQKAMVLKTVRQTLGRYRMIEPGDRVLAGVSGGPDSVALVHLLKEVAREYSLDLAMAHLNHGLREEASDRDEAFTASLARNLGLPLFREKAPVKSYAEEHGLSVEHAGRRLRYAFFQRIMETSGYSKLALGHHGDDNAEMVLMALIRGSGPTGLAGIPPVRENRIIRPLFHLTRRQILAYLEENRLEYVVDETNLMPFYLRNKIRLELIPLLENQYNPQIVRALNRLSDILRTENLSQRQRAADQVKTLVSRGPGQSRMIFIDSLNRLPGAEKRNLVREMIRETKGDLKRITLAHVDDVIHFAVSSSREGRLDLPDKILLRKINHWLFFSKEDLPLRFVSSVREEPNLPDYQYTVTGPQEIDIKEIRGRICFYETEGQTKADICSAGQDLAFFDIKKLKFPLILRNSRPGDRFVPLGMSGFRTVGKFLKDQGIPKAIRHHHPVLESGGTVIWVVGKRVDESTKVTENTRGVLTARFECTE
jgi:tRNA(Ile)-lysidine synthase